MIYLNIVVYVNKTSTYLFCDLLLICNNAFNAIVV